MIKQRYRKCSRCGHIGGMFVTRKHTLKNGKEVVYIGSICVPCANQESRERNRKLWKNSFWRKKRLKKLKDYRKKNRIVIREQNRIYYLKNRDRLSEKHKRTYVPKTTNPLKKNGHHRIPTGNNIFRKFDFKRRECV